MTKNLDIALSSRVRLARNVQGLPFPARMGATQLNELIESVSTALEEAEPFSLVRMAEQPPRNRRLLVERHMISPALAQSETGAAFIDKDETISVMVAEEDHLRIQCILPGLELAQADERCMAIDRLLGEKLSYAFDVELGYLTACPTNLGSGIRASVMLHLPALSLTGQSEAILSAMGKLGYAVRGIYGEGSSAPGHIYQISNQMTLGLLEEDILSNLHATVQRLMEHERSVRGPFYESKKLEVEDGVFRSLGALRFARKLKAQEAMEHISNLKLGASLGLLPERTQDICNALLTDLQSAALEKRAGRELNSMQRAKARADYLREQTELIERLYDEKRGDIQ